MLYIKLWCNIYKEEVTSLTFLPCCAQTEFSIAAASVWVLQQFDKHGRVFESWRQCTHIPLCISTVHVPYLTRG